MTPFFVDFTDMTLTVEDAKSKFVDVVHLQFAIFFCQNLGLPCCSLLVFHLGGYIVNHFQPSGPLCIWHYSKSNPKLID